MEEIFLRYKAILFRYLIPIRTLIMFWLHVCATFGYFSADKVVV